jgi:thiamine biosynthesis protein ThiS
VEVVVNGEPKEIPANTSVAELLDVLALPHERIAVERNRRIVRRSDWESVIVEAGDRLEIVHFVGGG